MDEYEEKFSANNTWCIDDLDGGLPVDLINLQCVRQSTQLLDDHNPAYNMTEVLELPIFKHADLDSRELLQSLQNSLQESSNVSFNKAFQSSSLETNQLTQYYNENIYTIKMKAPTAPGRKVEEETLTWLNQGQPYEVIIQTTEDEKKNVPGTMAKVVLSIGFHERQHQYFESEKYDEWLVNRPDIKMIELDLPMSLGVYNPVYVGQYTKEIEFKWDLSTDAHLFIKVNCLSSEFTKTKSGESGVVLRLQLDIFVGVDFPLKEPSYSAGCQVKVFRAKGANRKLKLEREKHEGLSKEESAMLQASQDITIFTKLDESKRMRRFISETPVKKELWSPNVSPTYTCNTFFTSSSQFDSCNSSLASTPGVASLPTLTASSTVEETETWLRYNRFQKYCSCFANFTGDDLLRLSRGDLIQLCGPADGIRLNNTLQARASRPLLTMYVSPECHQSDTGMREYRAMFLEQLTVEDLKRKIAKKCSIKEEFILSIVKQGPTGIHIHVDDEVIRNFADESHHVMEVLKEPNSELVKILLK